MEKNKLATIFAYKNLLLGISSSIDSDWRRVAKELKLTVPQHRLLWMIYLKPGATVSQLAYYSLWNVSNVMYVIDHLSGKELVTKYVDPRDTRVRRVYLTEQGQKVIQKASELMNDYHILQVFDQLDDRFVDKHFGDLYRIVKLLQGSEYVKFIDETTKKMLE